MSNRVVVVGAGAAGIIAAWRAATLGAEVVLLEKTDRLGTKILISGGGKCNIAHDGPIEDVLKAFRPNEARFIRPACYRFTNREIVSMLTDRGLEVYTRPDGRIFPVNQTAKDVVAILRGYLDEVGVETWFDCPVTGLVAESGRVFGVKFRRQKHRAGQSDVDELLETAQVIVAVGGSSYPNSGTTGDGWQWVKALGHTIVPIRAALAPIYLEGANAEFSGIALRDCLLKARQAGKEIVRWRGDLLFTHHGVSGPTVLGVSRVVAERHSQGEITLEIDVAPDRSFEELNAAAVEWAAKNPRKPAASFLESMLPARLIPALAAFAEIDHQAPANKFERKSRNRLLAAVKAWNIGRVRAVPLEKGEVVAGGISLEEVDPHSMRSAKIRGLYLCGEALDLAGPVGGYNLQAAFATGFVAGESAARDAGC